mgnify:CR=1 FL=1
MKPSRNSYDWLGEGCYFWENDPTRAFEFARDVKKCKDPFVLGAILDLGYCLDLTCRDNILLVKDVYESIVRPLSKKGRITQNIVPKNSIISSIIINSPPQINSLLNPSVKLINFIILIFL